MGTFLKKHAKKRAFKLPVAVLVCVMLVIGGGLAYQAVAEGTPTVTVDPEAVDVGQIKDLEFTVDSNGGNSLVKVEIDYSSTDFSNPLAISCPIGWSSDIDITNKKVKCWYYEGSLSSVTMSINSVSAPSNGSKPFSVSTLDTGDVSNTIGASVEVKSLSAMALVNPMTTNTEQIRIYDFIVTNNGEDNIVQIDGVLTDFSVNSCLATGWTTCETDGSSFALSGGYLAFEDSVNILVTATAPADSGLRAVSMTITGLLGGTATVDVGNNNISVQTPANLFVDLISSDKDFISENSGAYNTAIITTTVSNSGQSTANSLVKTLIIKDNGGADISSQFTITETDSITEIAGGASVDLFWTVTAVEGVVEGLDKAEILVGYGDINDITVSETATQINDGIFTVDNINPEFSNILADPALAKSGAITITFTASEELVNNPTADVNGNLANFISKTGDNYVYTYIVQETGEQQGLATISVDGNDLAN
ncbi:hypothetical protein KAU19_06480, partial [Candidatus Parcubacteria bacterium]|nr:hypothetical protein [Candidatus Parcubacteria bacterium]